MGKEGQNSPQDVADVNKKPWENSSEASSDGGKIKDVKDTNTKKSSGIKNWIKEHKVRAIAILIIILAFLIGDIFLVINISKNSQNAKEEANSQKEESYGPEDSNFFEEGFTMKDTNRPDLAYTWAMYKIAEYAHKDGGYADFGKVMDNIEGFIKTQNDYDKVFYNSYYAFVLADNGEGNKAKKILNSIKFESLDKNQKYTYLMCGWNVYGLLGEKETAKTFEDFFNTEFGEEEDYYVYDVDVEREE